jgi:hypothetical protein
MAAATLLTGCGGNSSSGSPKLAEARFVTLANALCHEYKAYDHVHPGSKTKQFLANKKADLARLHALVKASSKLASVRTYIKDLNKRKKWIKFFLSAIHPGFRKQDHIGDPMSYLTESYRLSIKVFDDEKALGLIGCIGPRPRPPIGD